MSFVNQYYRTLSFSKEFVENNESYIYSIGSPGGRIRDRFNVTKTDTNGKVVWSKEFFHSEMSFGEIELEMIQVGAIPMKESDVKAAFYGQYIITAKSTDNSTLNLLTINSDGDINRARAFSHLNMGYHIQRIVNAGNNETYFYVLSLEYDESSGITFQTLSRFDSSSQLHQKVSLSKIINANDLQVKNDTLYLAGNYEGRAAIAELYSWDFSVQNIYFLNAREDLHNIFRIEMNDNLILAAKVENGEGLIGIVLLNRNQEVLENVAAPVSTSNYIITGSDVNAFCLSNDHLYFAIEDIIYKTDLSLNIIWKKQISVDLESTAFNMLSFLESSGFLTATLYASSFADGGNGLSIYMDRDANTCVTKELERDKLRISQSYTEDFRAENPRDIEAREEKISYEVSEEIPKVSEICKSEGTILEGLEQSACLYLQAAGSTGQDSSAGIHLRWMLKGAIAEHLPKGDHYSGSPEGFNRPDDFVKIFKVPYNPVSTRLDFSVPPNATVDNMGIWLYQVNNKKFYVYFRNQTKYQQIRNSIDPLGNPIGFIQQYGNNLIEIEIKEHLFFAVRMYASGSTGTFKTEILSVETNQINLPKNTTFRQNLDVNGLSQKIFSENGRSIRFASSGSYITAIDFEFYNDFILSANRSGGWQELGKYSLSLDDDQIRNWLDPDPDNHPVHAVWPRYNDGEFVNIKNYLTKWNGDLDDERNQIKHSVKEYIERSNDPNNPLAIEIYHLENDDNEVIDDENNLEISHLSILQMASFDYHVARMLGLGHLDFASEVYSGAQFVYAAQYTTDADLNDGNGAQTVVHLSLSLPTSLNDQRTTLPVDLLEPVPGIISSDPSTGNTQNITDDDGYTHDGTARFLSLFAKELTPDEPEDSPFFFSNQNFDMSKFTYPVFVGIEYKREGEMQWRSTELPNDVLYQNVDSSGNIAHNETISIALPDIGQAAFVHRETETATHIYGSYGVNWFSRSRSSYQTWSIITEIKPANILLPPSNINATLIQKENPLLFTSQNEQDILEIITANTGIQDKTFIRLTFDYDASQDMISYLKSVNGQEVNDFDQTIANPVMFGDEVELFYRPQIPKQIFGTISSISDLPGNPLVCIIQSGNLTLYSTGDPNTPNSAQVLSPSISSAEIPNYIGGILTVGTDEFIIQDIVLGSNPDLPIIHILKKQVADAFGQGGTISFDPANFVTPSTGQSFMVVENMQNETTWGNVNPHPLKVRIGAADWSEHTEEVVSYSGQDPDITTNLYYRKFRGVYKEAQIVEFTDSITPVFQGVYKITFPGYILNNHPQYNPSPGQVSVQWYQGTIRIPRKGRESEERKILKVLRIDQDTIGNGDLIIYAFDESYDSDELFDSATTPIYESFVNFYPGYRVYLYHNAPCRLDVQNIYSQDENVLEKYTIFGLRSLDNDITTNNRSKISTPTLMFSRKIQVPQAPQQPIGALYATRPDYFGRSTYAFTTQYEHKPFSANFLRTNDDILLSSLYKQTKYGQDVEANSVEDIRNNNNDEFINDRLLDLANVTIDTVNHLFKEYNGYRLPIPNNAAFFENINRFIDEHNIYFSVNVPHISVQDINNFEKVVIPIDSQGRYGELKFYDFVKQTVQNTYIPLTEIPIIYQYIKSGDYKPIPKIQVIRDRNGTLLSPSSPDFDMAPMAKVLGTNPHKTLFVDFTLDGNSKSVYFYAVKESNSQMEQSELSPAVGPVRLVNSYPVKTPEIRSVIPKLENTVLGISPGMDVKINSYDSVHNIKKAKLYRALNMADAMSVRSMTLVKEVNLEEADIIGDELWTVLDDFSDLPEIPFSDPLYYRVTVEAEIEYAEAQYTGQTPVIVTDYAPSEVSKLMVTTITENILPNSPVLTYTAFPQNSQNILSDVIFYWDKQAYKAKYHLYKMNNQGNWVEIATVQTNDSLVSLNLADTDWGSGNLPVQDSEGNPIYHHFKVITENTAGMMSTQENILTIGSDLLNIIEDDINLARYKPYFGTSNLTKDENLLMPPFTFYNTAGGHQDNTGTFNMNNPEALSFWKQMQDEYLVLPEINTDIKKNPHVYNLRTKEFGCYYSYMRMWDGSIPGSSHHFLKNSVKKARKTGARECIINLGNDTVFVSKNIEVLKVALLSGNDKGMKRISLVINNILSHYTREEILTL